MKINITENKEKTTKTLNEWGNFKGNYDGEATLMTLYNRGLRAWIQDNGNFSVLNCNAPILEFDKHSDEILVYNSKGFYDDGDIPSYHGDMYDDYNDLLPNIRNWQEARLGIDFWTTANFDNVDISINY
ncbi:hypothetical protein FCF11_09480 [Latilactobacillus curvatus]|uniref:hypothetical protein n=1 Tax=Latilactobacillus curvatus TaxID=28038 RepID=UPI0010ADDF8C|nr:hypothetical protein [Latilactobacillus curvatus]TJY19774.1 hypothetical protein FCF11_09480 [Latilactobacillus curvatus]